MRLTKADVLFGIERLLQVYHKPKHGPQEVAELATVFLRELDDLDPEAFRAGVSGYCRSGARYFPKPGELRALGQDHRPTNETPLSAQQRWEQDWPEAPLDRPLPCPTCGAVDGWSKGAPIPTVRRSVPHDDTKHAAAGVPYVRWQGVTIAMEPSA